ncbi:MAG: CHAT domain-containing protein, partial [Cyanobacteria bacterium P01_H01_bin.15]
SAELGFAGLALKAGVKSALASLWFVSDFGTLALIGELYQHLGTTPTKAEALRRTQLNMIEGKVRVEGNQLILTDASVDVPIKLASSDKIDLSHPFYWAGSTMISSPW